MKIQETENAQNNLEKEVEVGKLRLLNFKICYKAAVIKTMWYWYKYKCMDLQNGIESPEINTNKYVQFIFNKDAKMIQW